MSVCRESPFTGKSHSPAFTAAQSPASDTGTIKAHLYYRLHEGKGGCLHDPDGLVSAVETLLCTHGDRLDLQDLLATIEHTSTTETQQATDLVRRLISNTRGNS